MILAGYSENYTFSRVHEIPAQWQRFGPVIGQVPGQVGQVAYGVCTSSDDNRSFEYLSAVEVADADEIDRELTVVQLRARRYAVFFHAGNVATLRSTMDQIGHSWAKRTATTPEHAPFFERYDKLFDPVSGNGGVEVWIPIKA